MNGHIANSVAIVCAGNCFLHGDDISNFWPEAPVFSFMKLVEFRHPPASGKDADDHPLVASDPMEWFETLKLRCHGLRLHQTAPTRGSKQQLDVPDRMLAGFVGGGQRWLIEAVGETESELWEPFHRVGDRNDPQRRIWKCTHVLQGSVPRTALDADVMKLDDAVARFRKALVPIETYARDEKLDNFADIFNEAIAAIDSGKPIIEGDDLMALYTGFSQRQTAIFEACSRAWVFGGMGSWNDIGGGERYDRVSQNLYDSLNDCIAALANSTFRG